MFCFKRAFAVAAIFFCAHAAPATPSEGQSRPDWWDPSEATAGMQLVVREESRNRSDPNWHGRHTVVVSLLATGFPKGKDYELWGSWLDLMTARFMSLKIDKGGVLRFVDPRSGEAKGAFTDFKITLGDYAKGEPASFALVSTDRKAKAFVTFVPIPLEARDRECRVWMELLSADGQMFLVQGEGFTPGEEVKILSRSNGERLPGKEIVSPEGKLGPVILLPAAVSGKHKASYTVTGKDCSVTIEYHWGAQALRKE